MKHFACLVAILLTLSFSGTAEARNDSVDFPIADAVNMKMGQDRLLDVPFYFKGKKYPAVKSDFGRDRSNRKTNAFNKSDKVACSVAFLSSLKALQQRAQQLGADAVVDITSVTKHQNFQSTSKYRCVVGNIIAHVGLEGRFVTFKK